MTATVHQHPAARASAAASQGPAGETPAPFSNPLTEKIAWAASLAFDGSSASQRALYAAEFALDEVDRLAKRLAVARDQLTDAIKKQREYDRLLNNLACCYMERMTPPASATGQSGRHGGDSGNAGAAVKKDA